MTVFGRSPELQKRIDEYHVLEQKEVDRIKSEYPTETVDQMIARLQTWQTANDFIAFVKPSRTTPDPVDYAATIKERGPIKIMDVGLMIDGTLVGVPQPFIDLSDRIKLMRTALEHAKQKLQLYRADHSGEYVGGVEYTALIAEIDAALKD